MDSTYPLLLMKVAVVLRVKVNRESKVPPIAVKSSDSVEPSPRRSMNGTYAFPFIACPGLSALVPR